MKPSDRDKLNRIFSNPVGRILVESYSNDKAEWKIPDLDKLLGPKKVKARSKRA